MYGRAYTIPGDNHYFVRRTVMSENDNVSVHDLTDEGEISSIPAYSDEDSDSNESLDRMAHSLMDRRLGINALMETNEDLVKIEDKNERLDKTLKIIEDKFRPLHATKYTIENMHHDLNLYKYMEMPKDQLMYVILSALQDLNIMIIKCGYVSKFFSTIISGSMVEIYEMYCNASGFETEYEKMPTTFHDFPAEPTSSDIELDMGLFVTRVALANGYIIRDVLQNVNDRAKLTVDKCMFDATKKRESKSSKLTSEYYMYWKKIMIGNMKGKGMLVMEQF